MYNIIHKVNYVNCTHVATEGQDYVLPDEFQIVFNTVSVSGNTECVNITITDDLRVEGQQEFLVTVDSVSPLVELPGLIAVVITISDDDGK